MRGIGSPTSLVDVELRATGGLLAHDDGTRSRAAPQRGRLGVAGAWARWLVIVGMLAGCRGAAALSGGGRVARGREGHPNPLATTRLRVLPSQGREVPMLDHVHLEGRRPR